MTRKPLCNSSHTLDIRRNDAEAYAEPNFFVSVACGGRLCGGLKYIQDLGSRSWYQSCREQFMCGLKLSQIGRDGLSCEDAVQLHPGWAASLSTALVEVCK